MSIPNPYIRGDSPEEAAAQRLRRWAGMASLSVAGVLIVTKLIAYVMTNSVSIMTSLMDSTFDALASAVMLFSIVHAATPADEKHRFGHGKVEALAAMGQAVFIFGSAGYLFFEAVHRFVHPQAVSALSVGIGVMVLSVVLTLALVSFQLYVIRRTQSIGISADHLHYKGDLLMNIAVITALALGHYTGWPYFDPLFAVVISVILLSGAFGISRESFDILMDKELPEEDRARILHLVESHKEVHAVHDLRTRSSGQQIFIEFHMEVDGALSLSKAHDITEEIEALIFDAFPKAEVIIHQEPAGLDDFRLDDQIKAG